MAIAYRTAPLPAAGVPGLARWLPLFASATITTAFAVLAFRLSFAALTDLAVQHGVASDAAWMFAALVDGGAVVGTVGVVAAEWSSRRAWPYWLTVVAFASLSLGFNIAHSDGSTAGVFIAITPPAAQLVATELLVRLLPTPQHATPAPGAVDVAPPEPAPLAATEESDGEAELPGRPDLTALLAAAEAEPALPAVFAPARAELEGPPELPMTATFSAPPVTPVPQSAEAESTESGGAEEAPPEAVTAYLKLCEQSGRRPTAEEFGAVLGVRRSRGGELRQLVEANLENNPCTVTVP
ncbi:DUF2637 domain-containing protein [Streptomyces fractus]|uniref:DUF2637 domain-containing protein n=1 Tax=Streptomyces fractus TaxID=641806 RepID=UPI003CF4A52E